MMTKKTFRDMMDIIYHCTPSSLLVGTITYLLLNILKLSTIWYIGIITPVILLILCFWFVREYLQAKGRIIRDNNLISSGISDTNLVFVNPITKKDVWKRINHKEWYSTGIAMLLTVFIFAPLV